MNDQDGRFPVYEDDRGRLLPIELDDVPFTVRRVFTVHGVVGGGIRAEHYASCAELIVLTAGYVRIEIGLDPGHLAVADLDTYGSSASVAAGDYVRYFLPDENASILVLAERPYVSPEGS